MPPSTRVLGVDIFAGNLAAAVETILHWVDVGAREYVCVLDAHSLVRAQHEPEHLAALRGSGITVPDGRRIWHLVHREHPEAEHIPGMELLLAVSRALAERGGTAFYCGGKPEVALRMATAVGTRFPGLGVAGVFTPSFAPFSSDEMDAVVASIRETSPSVVWVGLGAPKQERYMVLLRERLEHCVLIGVGAVFDYLTGGLRYPSALVRQLGLSWLHRTLQQPGHALGRYAKVVPLLSYHLARAYLHSGNFRGDA